MSLKEAARNGLIVFLSVVFLIILGVSSSAEDFGGIRSGETRTSEISPTGDMDTFNFYGKAGEGAIVVMSSSAFAGWISLYDPDGILETEQLYQITNHQLLKTGLYTIICADFWNDQTGSYSLSFLKIPGAAVSPSDKDGGDIVSGSTVSGRIALLADTDAYRFYGEVDEGVIITMQSSAFAGWISLYDPDGILETEQLYQISNHQLLKSGLYTIVCADYWLDQTGSYNLSFTKVPSTHPPGVYNPTPAEGSIVPSTAGLLDWDDTEEATHYDVYFGTNVTTDLDQIATDITVSQFNMPSLILDTTYYWKVVAKTASSDIQGPVWMFTAGYKDDLLGSWDIQGVYYRNSETGKWIKLASSANLVAAGDLCGDNIDDLITVFPSAAGVWTRSSSAGTWAKLSSATAKHIASGDMNGDSREDLLATWDGVGVFFRSSISGLWTKIAQPANLLAAGDLDGDSKDDPIIIFPTPPGVWVKYSKTGAWAKLSSSSARDIASGDMDGDGRDDLLGTWDGLGVYYRNSFTGLWVKMAQPADQVTAGEVDGNGADDLIASWTSPPGVFVKSSKTGKWTKLAEPAKDIAAGLMRGGIWGSSQFGFMPLGRPVGGYAETPVFPSGYEDLSEAGPGGWRFAAQEEENLIPQENGNALRTSGPGDPGFKWIEEQNLTPQEGVGQKQIRSHDKENPKSGRRATKKG